MIASGTLGTRPLPATSPSRSIEALRNTPGDPTAVYSTALTIASTTFLASPKTIIVLSM